ncbi:FadR/GntR family transcriptional regulator [Rhizobium esperanzae]|uniref:DNA-binding FadR family transcriptional regulator n=1 Tax=Rhizobium esperanzae TaxID=1967781 RepID=A0A7W6R440_9HYPH|nr:FadR/GntR family transcriptional regulator [Rhizobium esperanzae]MBB4235912.1 DNA-binding FadR family transcriptional regulator [Rhizobium esperanzae]
MSLQIEERVKLSDKVYESLSSKISTGEWPEGTRIPTEAELALMHSVSRPVIREALFRLRSEGIIGSKRGSGSSVLASAATPVNSSYKPIENVADLIHAFEFRLSVECDAAAVAAMRAEHEQINIIKGAHDAFNGIVNDENFGDLDLNFHVAIAKATGNQMFETTLTMLHSQIIFGMRLTGEFRSASEGSRVDVVRREHQPIVDAIGAREPKAAFQAMRQHLRASRLRILGFEVAGDWQRP